MLRIFIVAALLVSCAADEDDDASLGGGDDGVAADARAGASPDGMGPIADAAPAPDAAPMMVAMGLQEGQRAPDFTLPDHEGNPTALADFRGGHTFVFGSATW